MTRTKANEERYEIFRTFEDYCDLYDSILKEIPDFKLSKAKQYKKFKEIANFSDRTAAIKELINEILENSMCMEASII